MFLNFTRFIKCKTKYYNINHTLLQANKTNMFRCNYIHTCIRTYIQNSALQIIMCKYIYTVDSEPVVHALAVKHSLYLQKTKQKHQK